MMVTRNASGDSIGTWELCGHRMKVSCSMSSASLALPARDRQSRATVVVVWRKFQGARAPKVGAPSKLRLGGSQALSCGWARLFFPAGFASYSEDQQGSDL